MTEVRELQAHAYLMDYSRYSYVPDIISFNLSFFEK